MATPQANAPPRGGKKPLLLGAIVLVLGSAGTVGYLKTGQSEPAHDSKTPKPVRDDPGVVELEPFVLNLADPAGDRFFRLNVRLELSQKSIAARAASGLAEVKLRDRFLTILSRKRGSELTDVAGKEALREELRGAVETLLGEGPFFDAKSDAAPARVLDVLFTEFLVQ